MTNCDNFFNSPSTGVEGPASTTNNTVPRYSGTDGQTVKDSDLTLSDANEIASKTTNADIGFNPNGTGQVYVSKNRRDAVTNDAATTGSSASLTTPPTPIIRVTNVSLVSIGNIPAGTSGQELVIINRVGTAVTIINDSGGTANNRIITGSGSNMTLANNAAINLKYDITTLRWQVVGGSSSGSGDVVGPASATDNAVARFDLTTGKIIQNSVVIISDAGAVSGATQLDVDNLRLDGNTVSTTDTNGNLLLTPNGTGSVRSSARVELPEISTPSTPSSGFGAVYFKSDNLPYAINDAGTEMVLFKAPVNAAYSTNAGQTCTDGNNVIYEDSVYDTNSAYNTGTGVYTVPTTGKYRISASAVGSAHAGSIATTRFRINIVNITSGKIWQGFADIGKTTTSVVYNSLVSGTINCTAADQLAIRFDLANYTGTMNASNNSNNFSIEKID